MSHKKKLVTATEILYKEPSCLRPARVWYKMTKVQLFRVAKFRDEEQRDLNYGYKTLEMRLHKTPEMTTRMANDGVWHAERRGSEWRVKRREGRRENQLIGEEGKRKGRKQLIHKESMREYHLIGTEGKRVEK